MLSEEQTRELLRPIDPSRVGKDGKGFSHVEAWDVRRTMNRIFGFGGWSADVDEMVLVTADQVITRGGKEAWNVVYRARCTLQIPGATYTEWAAGDAVNPTLGDAHDQAIKTAESQAFKRCAVNLGDQFGLSLYNSGSMQASVGTVVGMEHGDSGEVGDLLAAFGLAEDMDDLGVVAQRVAALDLAPSDKELLRAAYNTAKKRLEAA